MGDLKVNFSTLSTAAADIQGSASKLERILDEMDRSLQPLRANWSGEASTSYAAAKTKWSTAIADMKLLLADVGREVSTSNDEYQTVERNNASFW